MKKIILAVIVGLLPAAVNATVSTVPGVVSAAPAGVTAGSVDSTKLATPSVDTTKLYPAAVDSTKLANAAVTTRAIAPGAVDSSKVVSGISFAGGIMFGDGTSQTTAASVGAGSIDTSKLATDAVTAIKISAGAVDTNKIGMWAVDTTKIQTDAVINRTIKAGSVDTSKLATTGVAAQTCTPSSTNGCGYTVAVDGRLTAALPTVLVAPVGETNTFIGSSSKTFAGMAVSITSGTLYVIGNTDPTGAAIVTPAISGGGDGVGTLALITQGQAAGVSAANVNIQPGQGGNGSGANGGSVNITGGTGRGSGSSVAGSITIAGGSSSGNAAAGGSVSITAGSGNAGNKQGGAMTIQGGTGGGSTTANDVKIIAGTDLVGGNILLQKANGSTVKTVIAIMSQTGSVTLGDGSSLQNSTMTVNGDLGTTNTLRQGIVLSCATGLLSTSTGAITTCAASDAKLKHNILDLAYDEKAIGLLRPRAFEWNDPERGRGVQAGFIAQEVRLAVPGAVVLAGSADTLGVEPKAILAVVVLELQHQRKQLASLEFFLFVAFLWIAALTIKLRKVQR